MRCPVFADRLDDGSPAILRYVVNASRLAKSKDPDHKQRLIYLSGVGADPNSWFLYPRSVSQHVARMSVHDGFHFAGAKARPSWLSQNWATVIPSSYAQQPLGKLSALSAGLPKLALCASYPFLRLDHEP